MVDHSRRALLDLRDSSVEELRDHVASRLESAGLTDRGFDLDVIVDDLRTRLDLDRELDDLIGPPSPVDPEPEGHP